jgi:hypothetical protein
MNDEPMMIDETEDTPTTPRTTAASWKKAQLILAGLASLFAVSLAMSDDWSKTFGGATEAQIAGFERAMNDYFDEAARRGLREVTMRPYKPFEADQYGRSSERNAGTLEVRERLAAVVRSMGRSNRGKAEAEFIGRARDHNGDGLSDEEFMKLVAADGEPWVMRNVVAGVWTVLKTAVIAFVVVWLLLKLCELFWWFLMDRLHDVANAVRRR